MSFDQPLQNEKKKGIMKYIMYLLVGNNIYIKINYKNI